MRRLLVAAFGILIAAAPAAAQDDRPIGVNFGFGVTFPVAGLKDSFDTGWNGAFGVTYNINPKLGVQAEYMYNREGGPDKSISVTPPAGGLPSVQLIESNHQFHAGTFNLVYRKAPGDTAFGGYVLGGLGIYHRLVQLTSPAVGFATYCDPYWYICYPTAVPVDRILGDRSSNDFGINIGGGITFGRNAMFYVEARYHYVWGPEVKDLSSSPPTSSTGATYSTSAQYFPMTFGVRW